MADITDISQLGVALPSCPCWLHHNTLHSIVRKMSNYTSKLITFPLPFCWLHRALAQWLCARSSMVSSNLNPGRKVLKVKPAVECIIMEPCSSKGEDTPPSRISHTLPACTTRGSRERGWQKSNGKCIQFLTTSCSLPHACNPFSLSVHSQPKRRGRHACKETTAFWVPLVFTNGGMLESKELPHDITH